MSNMVTQIKRHAVNDTTREITRYGYTLSAGQAARLDDTDWDWLRNVLCVRCVSNDDGSVDLLVP